MTKPFKTDQEKNTIYIEDADFDKIVPETVLQIIVECKKTEVLDWNKIVHVNITDKNIYDLEKQEYVSTLDDNLVRHIMYNTLNGFAKTRKIIIKPSRDFVPEENDNNQENIS